MFDLYDYPFPQFGPLPNAFFQTLLLLLCPLAISLLLGGFAGLFAFVKCHPLFTRLNQPFPSAHGQPGPIRASAYLALIPLLHLLATRMLGLADGFSMILLLSLGGTAYFAWHLYKALGDMDTTVLETALAFGLDTRQIILRVLFPENKGRICYALAETALFLLAAGAAAGLLAGGGLSGLAAEAAVSAEENPLWLWCFALLSLMFLLLGLVSARCARKAGK